MESSISEEQLDKAEGAFSENADKGFSEIHRLLWFEGAEKAMAKLEAILQNMEEFTEREQAYFRNMHLGWTRAADPSYRPPHGTGEEIHPLWFRYNYFAGSQAEAEKSLWTYVQYSAFGTRAFQDALADLAAFGVRSKNFRLARHAAEILLHHHAILNLVKFNPLMPVGNHAPSSKHEWPDGLFSIHLPYWAAIDALEEDPAQCWLDILELRLEITPAEERTENFYPAVLEALRKHYSKIGDVIHLEWLKAYEV